MPKSNEADMFDEIPIRSVTPRNQMKRITTKKEPEFASKVIPKFLSLGRIGEEDLRGSREVELVQLLIRLVIITRTRFNSIVFTDTAVVIAWRFGGVAAAGGGAGAGGAKWSGRDGFPSCSESDPRGSGAKHCVFAL